MAIAMHHPFLCITIIGIPGWVQLEPHSPECKHKFASVVTQVFKCSCGNEIREQCALIPMGLLVVWDACAQLVWHIHCLQPESEDILG